MAVYQIEHTGITVADIDGAVDWYRTNFGFEETRRFDKPELELKGATMQLGEDYLELLQPYAPAPVTGANGSLVALLKTPGVNHLALNVDDVTGAYDRLRENGVEFVTELLESRYFFCRDPFGSLIEVKQRK